MRVFVQIVLVAVGSALGGLTRWGVSLGVPRLLEWWKVPARVAGYPWATFLINVTGSLFLGWFATLLTDKLLPDDGWLRPDDLRLLLAVGFTGAYTTFSTFEYESESMLREGDGFLGMTYLFASVFFGLAAVRLGVFLAQGKMRERRWSWKASRRYCASTCATPTGTGGFHRRRPRSWCGGRGRPAWPGRPCCAGSTAST